MLTFVDFARRSRFVVDSYQDEAVGTLAKLETGDFWISEVKLNPQIVFSGETKPTADEVEALHHKAHKACFIANSAKSNITWS
jgi:organic hydroperoxide reductase OsmC/OhrA